LVVVVTWSGPATAGEEPAFDLAVGGCGQLVVTSISPPSGPTAGGTFVTIKGSGFEGSVPLVVGIGAEAASYLAVDDSTVTATTAPVAAGTYDVVVTSNGLLDSAGQ